MGNRKCMIFTAKCFHKLILLLGMTLLCCACGYKIRGAVAEFPAGIESIGIPTFVNSTSQYKIEQLVTAAVLDEFRIRTRAPVNSSRKNMTARIHQKL